MVRVLDPLVFNDAMMSRLGKGLGYRTVRYQHREIPV